ncbi:hypothetical protein Micbo1qcDRAFT_68861 [Microdochium bolleyi]|uniref:C2H2-type domain-containing protein n=1 Tax=Microdochium bolleyi TaxID=196109 RepID=A0A136J1K0_9PEZI|nr:hypothetical protein Micbo1qcDRAFT_68861 [Microdochium bolleyi]
MLRSLKGISRRQNGEGQHQNTTMGSQETYLEDLNQASNTSGRLGRFSNPLSAWYDANDGPWVHAAIVAAPENVHHGHVVQQSRTFMGYRNPAPPSEPDTILNATLPSDSGYFSFTHPSIAGASLCGENHDYATETGSIAGGIGGLTFDFPPLDTLQDSPVEFSQPEWPQRPLQPSPTAAQHATHNEGEWRCNECKQVLKTKSDMKKHINRHTKPFRCAVAGCKREEGFATANDLERHIRSCHPEQPDTGPRYLCTLEKCTHKGKIWPRADNFRSHIKRVHKGVNFDDEQLEKFLYRVPTERQDSSVNGLETPHAMIPTHDWSVQRVEELDVSQKLASETQYHCGAGRQQDNNSTPSGPGVSSIRTPIASSDLIVHPKASNAASQQATNLCAMAKSVKDMPLDRVPSRSQNIGDTWVPQSHGHAIGTRRVDKNHNILLKGVTPHGTDEEVFARDLNDDDLLELSDPVHFNINLKDDAAIRKLLDAFHKKGILQQHGYSKDISHSTTDDEAQTEPPIADPADSKISYGCRLCGKTFNRRCELRKHEKRHQKPFGCTFPECPKRFGSKNDWKRHENSQHPLREMWKCDERHPSKPSEPCSKIEYQRDDFRQHLVQIHSINEGQQVEFKVEHCWIDKNYDERFWCGFCNKIVPTKSTGQVAGTERFDHIGNHYAGRNGEAPRNIDDWRHVDLGYLNMGATASDTDPDTKKMEDNGQSYPMTDEQLSASGKKRKRPRAAGNADDSRLRKQHTVRS